MHQKVLFLDAQTGFYKIRRYEVGRFFGPVDLGLHLSSKSQSINIGVGLLAGSIFPGSNRLFVTGFSPCWRGFYVSSMGGAGLVFDNLGLNMVSILGKAPVPSILYLNRSHGEEVEVEVVPVDLARVWEQGRGGAYALMDHVYERFGRPLRHGPARARRRAPPRWPPTWAASCPCRYPRAGSATWTPGRGAAAWEARCCRSTASRRSSTAAPTWTRTSGTGRSRTRGSRRKYKQRLLAKDMEATTKYRFDPKFNTGGTFGVNYAGDRRADHCLQLPHDLRHRAEHGWTCTSAWSPTTT